MISRLYLKVSICSLYASLFLKTIVWFHAGYRLLRLGFVNFAWPARLLWPLLPSSLRWKVCMIIDILANPPPLPLYNFCSHLEESWKTVIDESLLEFDSNQPRIGYLLCIHREVVNSEQKNALKGEKVKRLLSIDVCLLWYLSWNLALDWSSLHMLTWAWRPK